jgi:hypothetical protein
MTTGYTTLQGLEKTYAHYLLFNKKSEQLTAVLTELVPDEIELYKDMFESLNKKHVRAGLETFGSLKGRLPPKFVGDSLGGFEVSKYTEMYNYSPLSSSINPFANDYSNEIHSNQTMIDLIHEMVIRYIPKDASDDIRRAKDNLQKSLNDGYLHGKSLVGPRDINKNELPDAVQAFKDSDVYKNMGKVYEMEAIAELHRYAHDVDIKNAVEVVAVASNAASTKNAVKMVDAASTSGGKKTKSKKQKQYKRQKSLRKK